MVLPDLERCKELISATPVGRRGGVLTRVVGLLVECRGLSSALGDLCRVELPGRDPLIAEVVGFRDEASLLMPLGPGEGMHPGARVMPLGRRLEVPCGPRMLGRVLDGLGRPIDGGPELGGGRTMPLMRAAPSPLERTPIDTALPTGISVIDGLTTLGRGQRMGIFAGSGVGKSTLLADMARETQADVNVIALIGERGREVRHFIEEALGPEGLRKSVIIVATSDSPPLIRLKASFTAIAVAEYFRDEGKDVLLMMDSVTRLAAATREVGLALGEPPTVRGYPPSFFSTMPQLVERLGRTARGSITGIITVLVEGDDMNDPVADTMRGLLDGHIVLSRKVAHRGHFPAVDVLASVSRLMDGLVAPEHRAAANHLRSLAAAYEEARDLIAVGAYKAGSDPKVDAAVKVNDRMEALLRQQSGEGRSVADTVAALVAIQAEGTVA